MTFAKLLTRIHRVFDLCPAGLKDSCQVHLLERAVDIPPSFREELLKNGTAFLQPAYLRSLEESAPQDMQFLYACIERKQKPLGFLYFQVLRLQPDQAGGFLNPRYFSKELENIRRNSQSVILKSFFSKPVSVLFGGNVFLSGEYFSCLFPGTPQQEFMDLLPVLVDEVGRRVGENEKIAAVVIKDFFSDRHPSIPSFEKAGFKAFFFEPNMVMDLHSQWKSFDDYLGSLTSKYRVRARNVLKKAAEIEIRELHADEIASHSDRINQLYDQVHKKAAVHFSAVNVSYFENMKRNINDQFSFKGFFLGKEMIAFSSLVCLHRECEAHLVGLSYEYNKSHSLYLLILYQYVRDAIEKKSGVIYFGRTASEIKSTIGARPRPMYCYLRVHNQSLEKLIAPFSHINGQQVMRDPFRETVGDQPE